MEKKHYVRVLVCGGRDFQDYALVKTTLDRIHRLRTITHLIHGAARGADSLGEKWGSAQIGVVVESYPADWLREGKSAGFKRNERMLAKGRPDVVVAFPGGVGTAHMVRIARAAGVPVMEVVPPPTPTPAGDDDDLPLPQQPVEHLRVQPDDSAAPRVVHIRDKDKPNTVYIGRPSKWGNPFPLKSEDARQQEVWQYEQWLQTQPELIAAAKRELRGKNLACFCAPKACHGDVLLKVANA